MKRMFQNGMRIFITLILLFTIAPIGVMAEDIIIEDENAILKPNTATQSVAEVNVEFTTRYLGDFKVNNLTATRSGSSVVVTFSYESSRDGGYSFFNPPNGNAIMKYDFSGIKKGADTIEINLTLSEFKQVLASNEITMKFWVPGNPSASWIFFKPVQLSSLATQEELDNITEDILPTNITLNKTSTNLEEGSSDQLSVIISPVNTTNSLVAWSSSNSSVATVDSNGNINAINTGIATITATTVNNLKASCVVTVAKSDFPNSDFIYTTFEGGISITGYQGSDSNLIIPSIIDGEKVVALGSKAFNGCNSLTDVTIPDSVTSIGDSAFIFCNNLNNANIPKSVTYIGDKPFNGCTALKNINVDINNQDYSSINGVLFDKQISKLISCPSSLNEINIPNSVTTINNYAFLYCAKMSTIILPDSIKNIGDRAFSGCGGLIHINIPNGVTNIGDETFFSCRNLESITLPNSVISIGKFAFAGCHNLTTIDLPKNLKTMGDYTFKECYSLKSICIPSNVASINRTIFEGLYSLTSIQLDSSITEISDYASTFPASAKIIGYSPSTAKDYAQKYNRVFEEIENTNVLPSSIILNKNYLTLEINDSEKLDPSFKPSTVTNKTISWSSSNPKIATVDPEGNVKGVAEGTAIITAMTVNGLSAKCNITIKKTADYTDIFTYSLFEDGITITGYTSDISDISIPETIEDIPVTSIADWAFSDCTSLNSVNIPNTVKIIGVGSFSGCLNLTTVALPETLTSIGSGAFRLCENLTTIELPDDVSYLGEGAFYSCKGITSINLPSNITTLYANTFKDCTNLETITIPTGVKLVGYAAFLGCSSLEAIQFNSATTKIVDFENVIPSSATIVGYNPSIAKTYAQKYNRKFKELGNQNSDDSSISYQTHVQDVGWQDLKYNGQMSGTSGRSLRLEGIKIQLNNYENLGVTYQTHIQNIGWEANTNRGWKSDGEMSGTEGLSYRLEAIQIKLTGSNAENYDIYYQVHAQNVGWMGWAKNGESAGTAGYGYRLEGIQIKVVPKGEPAPSDNVSYTNPFKENNESPYSSILQEYRVAEANGFSQSVIKTLPNVNTELYGSSYKTKLYYILEDISGDSSPELVIAMYNPKYNNSVHPNDFQIYDVYRLNNGAPERIFDIYTMGYRSIYTICENQIIRCYGSGGVNAHEHTFYKLDGNTATTIQKVTYDNPYYILNDAKNNNRTITKAEADRIINSYIPRTDINWIKL